MDAKVIILLVFILFGMIVAYMVANGMVDLTSIFSRVTKSQAQESLGGVKLEVVSPVPSVYYQATGNQLDLIKVQDPSASASGDVDMSGIVKITGKNLDQKTITISVASPHWYFDSSYTKKTEQFKIVYDSGDKEYLIAPASVDSDGNGIITVSEIESDIGATNDGDEKVYLTLYRDTSDEPFNLPEFVELIFAVGETAKAEVTIVAEP